MAKLSYGSLYFSSPAITTLAAATPTKASGTTTAHELGDFTHANNRLTFTQPVTRDFVVVSSVQLQKQANSAADVTLHLAKNGTPVASIKRQHTIAPHIVLDEDGNAFFDDTPFFLSMNGTVELAQNDYLELFVETDTGDDLTVLAGEMTIKVAG